MTAHWKQDRFGALERGENPMVLARMKSGCAVIGDTQCLPGYSVFLAYPRVGEAIQQVCRPLRINYAIYGNADTYLHAHIWPRYEWEPAERRVKPVWLYPGTMWTAGEHQYSDKQHGEMRGQIAAVLQSLLAGGNPCVTST